MNSRYSTRVFLFNFVAAGFILGGAVCLAVQALRDAPTLNQLILTFLVIAIAGMFLWRWIRSWFRSHEMTMRERKEVSQRIYPTRGTTCFKQPTRKDSEKNVVRKRMEQTP